MNPGSRCRYGNAGRQTRDPYPKIQRFSVGGAKETAYAVYSALTDTSTEGYARVRQGGQPTASADAA